MSHAAEQDQGLMGPPHPTQAIRRWAAVSACVGVLLILAALQLKRSGSLSAWELPGLWNVAFSGVALAGLAIGALLAARRLAALEPPASPGAPQQRARWLQLFVISFVTLFVEVALIRYTGSQVRVFSFYKNVPLIGAFLGLGLGCWLGRGTQRQILRFLAWLVPFVAVLSASPTVLGGVLGRSAAFASSEHVLGDVVAGDVSARSLLTAQAVMAITCVVTLVAVTLLFVELGRLLGGAFEGLPRLAAYSVNILGSLVGVLAFTALSYAETPPWVWFAVGLSPLLIWMGSARGRLLAGALIGLNALAVWPSIGDTVWSPYQKLVGHVLHPFGERQGLPPGYLVQISDVFYQIAVDQSRETVARVGRLYPHYDAVYAWVARPQRVLIVGSGTGNDVAAALRAGAEQVDAVDIDPAIVRLGRLHHPEHPYDSPRVRLIVEDARAALRRMAPSTYDVVVFGLLDSHTQLGQSSLRLDNYVFTVESFQGARRVVRPGGHVVVTAAAFRPWFVERIRALLVSTVNPTMQIVRSGAWWTFIAEVPRGEPSAPAPQRGVTLPDDDWPFLYLPTRAVPPAYVVAVLVMALASVVILRLEGLRFRGSDTYHAHLFFLGAAFLLMEVHAVNRLALLFGTTWIVSAVTIMLVLLLILCANLTTALRPEVPYVAALAGLLVSLVASYAIQPGAVLGRGTALAVAYGVLLLSPVYFGGLIFARSFRLSSDPGAALGANILGSVLGGWSEYASMAYGMRVLVLLAFAFYAVAALAHMRIRPQER